MSVRVGIVVQPIEEWCLKARELSITSTNELMPMIYRMIKLIGIVKTSQINSETLSAALSELQYEQDKSYSRDSDRDNELHDMIYGLCQCLLEAYSTDHELSPEIPSSTNTVVGSRSAPTVTPTVSTVSYLDEPSTSSACGYTGQHGNIIQPEYENDSEFKPDISQIDTTPVGMGCNYSHSMKPVTAQAPTTTSYPMSSFEDMPKLENMEDESIPLNDTMNDIDEMMEELDNDEEDYDDDVEIIDRTDIDPNEVTVEYGLKCPICQKSFEKAVWAMNHMQHAHKVTLKMLGGRIECRCGRHFDDHRFFVHHIEFAKRLFQQKKLPRNECVEETARVLYVESKVKVIKKRIEIDHARKKTSIPVTECPLCRESIKAMIWYECPKCKLNIHSEGTIRKHLTTCYRPDRMVLWKYADE